MIISTKSLSMRHTPTVPSINFPDINVPPSGKILLLGESGCGKTTLLSILAGLLKPSTGEVTFHGQNFYDLPSGQRDRLRGQNFGFVFQTLHLIPALTIAQNIALATTLADKELSKDRLHSLTTSLGLQNKLNRKPSELSQGEQQRAAIARALINKPAILIADEPTSALDDKNTEAVMDLLEEHAMESGSALLVATHDQRIKHRFETILTLHASAQIGA
jgi:ABC-type lipoprotein export system ATPase subunit